MRSLRTRILFSATLVLVLFLGATGFLLDRAFQESALNAVEDRLRGRIFMLIGAADFDVSDADLVSRSLPDPALSVPAAGHYARILSASYAVLWSSRSMLGINITPPTIAESGQWALARTATRSGEGLFELTYGIIWEGVGEREPTAFVLQAFEDEKLYVTEVSQFRRSLLIWFAGLSVAMLLVQALNLSRGLRPLSDVGEEVRAIEQGQSEQINGEYPSELSTLTSNLNRLLKHNRQSLKRHRNSLGDLAHSIKTPLAVLRSELDSGRQQASNDTFAEQIERIDHTVQYYLERSAAAGRQALSPPVNLARLAERIVATLAKVHAEKNLEIRCDIPANVSFAADEGDLMEIIGNLADNACKWASRTVTISIGALGDENLSAAPGAAESQVIEKLAIEVRDDGPGIPVDQIDLVMQRGTRLDESVEGHGIGLAIVREMVEQAYGGRLVLSGSAVGTVARVEMILN